MVYRKLDQVALFLKDDGNKELMKGDLSIALLLYNKALCYAKSKEMSALIYANRSVIYLKVKLYDECLKNIQWARENGYPGEKIQKLDERQEKCKKLNSHTKNPVNDPWNFFKLTYRPNPQIPFIADCLEMRKTEKYGRGIYATRDLKPGDIVAIEDMVVHSLINETSFDLSCAYCSKGNQLNFIPCLKTTHLMFCSLECRENCYAKIHEADLMKEDHTIFAYARILVYLEEMFGSIDEVIDYLEDISNNKHEHSVFDFDFSNPNDPEYNRNLIKCYLSSDYKNSNEIIEAAMSSWQSKNQTCETLSRVGDANKSLKPILLVWSFLKNTTCNFNFKGFPFANLLNHSCVPNVHRLEVDTKSVIYVTQPIKAGEQLLESYSWLNCSLHYFRFGIGSESDLRKAVTISQYQFNCDCYACTHDVASFRGQQVMGEVVRLLQMEKVLLTAIEKSNFKPALDQLANIHKIINENIARLTSFDVTYMQNLESVLLSKIGMKTSHPFEYEAITQISSEELTTLMKTYREQSNLASI